MNKRACRLRKADGKPVKLYCAAVNARFYRGKLQEVSSSCFPQMKEGHTYWQVCVRQYCAEINKAARNRMELIVPELAKRNGVIEKLKAESQMEWVRQMNACKAQAEAIVKFELIYD